MNTKATHRDPVEVRTMQDITLLVLHEEVAGNLATAAERIVQELQYERLGHQVDMQGLLAGTRDADRAIRYLTKYPAKSIDALKHDDDATARQCTHTHRLADELRWLPCSTRRTDWRRHDIQPKNPTPDLGAGDCGNKARDAGHLGYRGHRVLVSRKFTGKTLIDHRAAIVPATLEQATIDPDAHDLLSGYTSDPNRQHRYDWTRNDPRDLGASSYGRTIVQSIRTAQSRRTEYQTEQRRDEPDIAVIPQSANKSRTAAGSERQS